VAPNIFRYLEPFVRASPVERTDERLDGETDRQTEWYLEMAPTNDKRRALNTKNKKFSYRRESADLTSLYRAVQKTFRYVEPFCAFDRGGGYLSLTHSFGLNPYSGA